MSGLQRFEFGALDIRVELDEGEPWFALADVCAALDLVNPAEVGRRIPGDEKGIRRADTPGGMQNLMFVSEPGLYRVIFRSNKPEAARFQRWVFHEVLPTIRQTGSFHAREDEAPELPDVDQPLLERIVRYPDGREVIERFAEPRVGRSRRAVAALPEPPPVRVDVPFELLRKRFHGALFTALEDLPEYRRLRCSQRRGEFCHRLNSALKSFVGRERSRWSALDYHNGVHWLLMQYGVDIRWILEWDDPSFVTHRLGRWSDEHITISHDRRGRSLPPLLWRQLTAREDSIRGAGTRRTPWQKRRISVSARDARCLAGSLRSNVTAYTFKGVRPRNGHRRR